MNQHTLSILKKCTNWKNFKDQIQTLSGKQKGDCFETLTYYYLQLFPTYATKLKRVWYLHDVPHYVHKQLNLPAPDEGIDLVAETKEGKYWVVQCKYREDEDKSLTRKELSTFTDLAFNICKNIELGLVCATADRFSYKLRWYGERLSFCTGDVWRGLEEEFFQRLHNLVEGKAVPIKSLRPRSHQKRAIQNAYQYFIEDQNTRGKLIMPCGTGKSLAAYWITERLGAKTVLVAVPSLALIQQSLKVWARESLANQKDVIWICVCSDETVGDIRRDDLAVLTQDLGVRVHTDPDEITDWLKTRSNGTTVVFSTYQSGRAIAEAAKKSNTTFDIGILDEAHKTVGRRDSLFGHLLRDENIKIKHRIFMTATERRYAGQSENIVSMENPKLFGETIELLSFSKALDHKPKILSDYKIITIMVTQTEIAKLIEDNIFVRPDKGRWNEEVEAEMLAACIALRKAMLNQPIKHAVSFHSSIARAKSFKLAQDAFTKAFPEYGKLETFHVSGRMPTATRRRDLDEFSEAKRGLITNARCLIEGVDVPNIDCVLFADPKKSIIDIVQAVGRALRPFRGKQLGYVVIPVLLGIDDIKETAQLRAFDTVLTVLRALASNDERIIEYFRAIALGRRHTSRETPVEIDLPEGLKINAEKFINSVRLKFWSRLAKLSWRPFNEAREFVHTLRLKNQPEWKQYCIGELTEKGTLPEDIPAHPALVYKEKGWINLGDWLGTGTVATFLREYRPFEEARKFVHSLKLKSNPMWKKYKMGYFPEKGTLPEDIPANPDRVYKDKGWINWGDWLGTGKLATKFRKYKPFIEARKFVQTLDLNSVSEWWRYCKGELPEKGTLPIGIPATPWNTYKNKGWISFGDWLGTGYVASQQRQYRSFIEARKFARSLKLKNSYEWRKFCKGELPEQGTLPDNIPAVPWNTYKNKGWISFGDWLGTGYVASQQRQYRSFIEARKFARSLKLKSRTEWEKYKRGNFPEKGTLPEDIPAQPSQSYKEKGWISWNDWLGTGRLSSQYLHTKYRSFQEARKLAQSLGLKSGVEWRKFCKGELPEKGALPNDIPANPWNTYKNQGWIGLGDWLGTGRVATFLRNYRPFEEARKFVHSLKLKNQAEWRKYCKGGLPEKGVLPEDIPSNPVNTYKDKGWVSLGDWLGTGTRSP